MKTMKRLLLLLLILGLSLTAAALAETLPDAWEGKILKLTLENGFRLGVEEDPEYSFGITDFYYSGGEETTPEEPIPVYTVRVPANTENVYLYPLQDMDTNYSAFSIYDKYYAALMDVKTTDSDRVTATVLSGNSPDNAFQAISMGDVNLPSFNDGATILVAKIDEIQEIIGAGPEGKLMLVFQAFDSYQNICYPFALNFVEGSMNTSSIPVEEITIDCLSVWDATKAGDETIICTANVHPIGATNASSITFTSSDESIISIGTLVDGDGSEYESGFVKGKCATLIPHKVGTATITATCGDVTCSVDVKLKAVPVTEPTIDAVELDKTSAALWHFAPGQEFPATGYEAYRTQFPASLTLAATAKAGENSVEDAQIEWSSSNPAVATVNNGVITATGAGSATITAACGEIKAECAVTVNSFVTPGYTNHVMGADWKGADVPASEIAINSYVYDLSDSTAPKSFTVIGSVYKNVGAADVKTLSSIQAMKWRVIDSNGCVTYTDDGKGTITITPTGNPGKAYFQPQLLNGDYQYQLTIHFTNGIVEKAAIARTDGQELTYTDTITIGEKSYNVFEIEQGDEVSLRIETGKQVSQSSDAWQVCKLISENTTEPGQAINSKILDLSTFAIGTYEIYGRTPLYESGYKIDAFAPGKGVISTDRFYVRIKEKPAIVPGSGDITGDGTVNASDAVVVLRYFAGSLTEELTTDQLNAADVNNDGKVNATDAVIILRTVAGAS